MSSNNTQPGKSPTEPNLNNNENEMQIDHVVYTGIINISQSSPIEINTRDMIPSQLPTLQNNTPHEEILLGRQQVRRQQERQQRPPRRQRRRRGRRSLRRQQRYQRWLQRLEERYEQPNTTSREYDRYSRYWSNSPDFSGEDDQENLLEAYDWEMMSIQERRDQIHLIELEGFAALEQILLTQDEREQSQQIIEAQQLEQEEQQQLDRLQDWRQNQLRDFETLRHQPELEQHNDLIEQIYQIHTVEQYDVERLRNVEIQEQLDQDRVYHYQRLPTPPGSTSPLYIWT